MLLSKTPIVNCDSVGGGGVVIPLKLAVSSYNDSCTLKKTPGTSDRT